jgi:ubiquinone/menaquinone biosynthesis C-methylase UbiE
MSTAEIWKDREVAKAFLDGRSLTIPDRERQLEVMLRVIRFERPPPVRVLDLGTGNGILLATLLEVFPTATGVAIDFSPLMLEQARKGLAKFGQRATLVEGELQTPAWMDSLPGRFDCIVSGFAIHHLTDDRKRALYREIHALLNDGGVFINCEHVASATPRLEEMFIQAMAEHLYQRRKEKGEEVTLEQVYRDYAERPDRAANILVLVEDQCHWLREIGFREVDCFWKCFELAVFGGVK